VSWEQRNADFCKAQADAQMAYIEAEREVDRLETENAKLRQELEQWERLTANIELPEYPTTQFAPKDLERENAKLRELVRAAWKCIHSGLSCSDCRLIAGGCTLQTAMRELGVD
jgi:hypothetical protein